MTEQTQMGPPPWSEAPEWAQWRAMDGDGAWGWYNVTPTKASREWVVTDSWSPARGYASDAQGRGWVETLESRPTDTGEDWPGHTSPEAMSIEDEAPELTLRGLARGLLSGDVTVTEEAPGYESLRKVLDDAYDQAARGKGKERHGNGQSFDRQPMQHLISDHGLGFATGQAAKKASEALGMDHGAARRELLGAIVYLAGAIVWMDRQEERA